MILCGCDRLLRHPDRLRGRRWALLSHHAAVTEDLQPLHLALTAQVEMPTALFAPEHGYWAVEQDMVPAADARDAWTGVPIRSLYGDGEGSLRPAPEAFDGLDVLIVDLQDVGSRYYTYAATAVWAADVALARGVEVWVLDRPNPLGGERLEGPGVEVAHRSFVGAFDVPVRHGLTLGELMRLEAKRRGWDGDGLEVWTVAGWRRATTWESTARRWIAPSPNMPSAQTAEIYPGLCLIEATTLSEGRGTTRPFHLVGAPGLDPRALADRLEARRLPGIRFLPTYFRPQFQKHAGEVCAGVELVVVDSAALRPLRLGVELLRAIHELAPDVFGWRREPYEFVADRPAIDLLTGSAQFRRALEGGDEASMDAWLRSWRDAEDAFRVERRAILLYD
ncbi:MAG: DUF1343 domain-containing protein [Acidobacteriota bacterium]